MSFAEHLQTHDCRARTPIARGMVEIVKMRGETKVVWQFVMKGALVGIAVRFCPFCGAALS